MFHRFLILSSILLTISACSSPTSTPVSPELIILKAADRMTESSGFRFSIDRSGAPAFLDSSEILSLGRLEGDYIAPDKVQATARIVTPGLVTEVSFVSIGQDQWQTNPFSGTWETLPENAEFNPALLFDPDIGLQAILETDLLSLALLEKEELETTPGLPLYHLRGELKGEKTFAITYGLIGPETMEVELWIAPDTYELHRMILLEKQDDPENARTWQLDFWDFDLNLEISPPE